MAFPLALAMMALLTPAPQRVLVVDLDDVGYDLLEDTPTPTLDRIAAAGRFFDSFVTAPLCSPTRAMFNLGAYPSHRDVLLGQVVPPNSSFRMPLAPLMPIATLVSNAGFTTAKIGKWHLCGRSDLDHVNEAGWQYYAGAIGNVQQQGEGYGRFRKVINGVETPVTNLYMTTDETDDAIALVQSGVNLISVSYHAPHKPWHVPPAHLHSIPNPTTDRDKARAMLQACDKELGRLVGEALSRGYLVIIFSDNGTAQPLGGQKGTVYEGGINVPFWAIGPGVFPGLDHSRISAVDFYASIAELFGIATADATKGPHSGSFVSALAGAPLERRFAYTERFRGIGVDPRSTSELWRRAVRGGRYKLHAIRLATTFEYKFFDIVNDPGEVVDLLQSGPLAGEALYAHTLFFDVLTRLGSL